ncbi:MAG: hypothetical protein HYU58_11490 [Proteobacteria bacterium]|nr:hypothetical protein [Pseudomonadota bacterium]
MMLQENLPQKIGIEAILDLQGADREAKAYAFLYAAFKQTEISSNPIRDALDCLTPFIAPYLNTIVGSQVTVDGIQHSLKASFGFDIPLYAIEQLLPALKNAGYVEYNRNVRAYFAKQQENRFDVLKSEIETEFDEVSAELSAYAKEVGFTIEPPSGNWDDALVSFLKTRTAKTDSKFANVKGVLLDPAKVEHAIVGAFVKSLHDKNPISFRKILNIFMGVLVEEFISSVSEIGAIELKNPVIVFYDTAVLLRLLGCSGRLFKTATDELTRYLQDLGFQIYYFSGNETEVAGILDTLIHIKDTGRELEGETAEAISNGDVTMTHIRMLQNSFPDRLAAQNVFPAENLEKDALDNAKYQIDERGFAEHLKQQALANRRNYGFHNRENDAKYLGTVMRLRKRLHTRDLAACGFVFVTTNKFLAQSSRRYLIQQGVIQPHHCPPVLSVGQIATIAWLMKDQGLEPDKAGRELLSNCYAAFRPDQEWFRHFREGIEKVTGDIEEFGKNSRNAFVLQAARRIAQEESFGDSAIVRELNMVEILQRAEQENTRALDEKDAQIEVERAAAALEYSKLAQEAEQARANYEAEKQRAIESAIQQARNEAARETEDRLRLDRETSAYAKADRMVFWGKLISVLLFLSATSCALYLQWRNEPSNSFWAISIILALVNVASFMELVRFRPASQLGRRIRNRLARIWL